jgi:L-alanine-DL-glutamate epimerase-like enolase superfamily enzyme
MLNAIAAAIAFKLFESFHPHLSVQLHIQAFTVHKRFALRISRGTTTHTTNLWVKVEHEDIEGWGEASPFSIGSASQTTAEIGKTLSAIAPLLKSVHPLERQLIERLMQDYKLPSAARAALDMALHDWLGKAAQLPLWQLWGLERERIVPTSVTIGISSPMAAQERVLAWLGKGTVESPAQDIQALKVKLGSPDGAAADRAMFEAVQTIAPHIPSISIDANGGWTLDTAIEMSHWLCDRGVTYLEQPLPQGQERDLPELLKRSPLPIFVDESCFTCGDIPALSDRVHGINIKLMKSGGLSEALRMIHTARACGLKIMFGCYSDSTLANTALAQLAPLADHLDLDSHLNLKDDPFLGATFQNGRVIPNGLPGLGVRLGGV